MNKTDEAAARLRASLSYVPNVYWAGYHDDLRAVLDERDALVRITDLQDVQLQELTALRARLTEAGRRCSELEARLEAAENAIVDALQTLAEYAPSPYEVTHGEQVVNSAVDDLTRYKERFGGRDDKALVQNLDGTIEEYDLD